MGIPYFPRLSPGQSVPADDWNQLVELVETLARPTGTEDTQVTPSVMGATTFNTAPREIWARITSGSGPTYAFQEVNVNDDGTNGDQSQDYGGVVGDGTILFAVESSGVTGLAADSTIYRMTPSPQGVFFTFKSGSADSAGDIYARVTGPSTPTGSYFGFLTQWDVTAQTWSDADPGVGVNVYSYTGLMSTSGNYRVVSIPPDTSGMPCYFAIGDATESIYSGASYGIPGLMGAEAQSFNGIKTFRDPLVHQKYSSGSPHTSITIDSSGALGVQGITGVQPDGSKMVFGFSTGGSFQFLCEDGSGNITFSVASMGSSLGTRLGGDSGGLTIAGPVNIGDGFSQVTIVSSPPVIIWNGINITALGGPPAGIYINGTLAFTGSVAVITSVTPTIVGGVVTGITTTSATFIFNGGVCTSVM